MLALVQGHFPSARRLTRIKKGLPLDENDKEIDVCEHLPNFEYAASRVDTFIDLDDFVEESHVDEETEEENDESDEL